MPRLSLSDLQRSAKQQGGECLATEYVNATTPVWWRCAKGHEWETAPTNVLHSGSWCHFCAGRKHDLDEMKSVALSRGGCCLSDRYRGMQTKLRWQCAHGHEWETTPATVLIAGAWCPECSTGIGERLTRAAFEQLFDAPFLKARPAWLRSRRGTQLELDGYNAKLGVAFEHQGEQHYTATAHYAKADVFARRLEDDQAKSDLCKAQSVTLIAVPEVGRRLALHDLTHYIRTQLALAGVTPARPEIVPDFLSAYASSGAAELLARLQSLAARLGGACLETHFLGTRVRHRFRCAAGHEWRTPADTVLRGRWCPRCSTAQKADKARNSIARIQHAAAKRQGKLISTEYHNSREHLVWECAAGHQWRAPYNRIRSGKWCPTCAKRDIDEFAALALSRAGRLVSSQYFGVAKALEWECGVGHKWFARPNNVINGTWCPLCAPNRRLSLTDMQRLATLRGGSCLSLEYKNARSKLRWCCSRGHEWEAVPHAVKAGSWCPQCAKMKT